MADENLRFSNKSQICFASFTINRSEMRISMKSISMKSIRFIVLDIFNIVQLRIKLLISNRLLTLVVGLFFIVAVIVTSTFFVSAKDTSTIPIGIVDMDNSAHSKRMIESLRKNKLLKVIVIDNDIYNETNEKGFGKKDLNSCKTDLIKKLKKGEINSGFIIKEKFGYNIENNKVEHIIESYYCSNQNYAKLISDIVLSSILDDVCYFYSQDKYYSLKNKLDKVYTRNQYKKKINKLYETSGDSIGFDFDIVNIANNKSVNQNIDITLIYREIIIGITALIIMIICLLVGNIIMDDYDNKVLLRNGTTMLSTNIKLLGDIFSMWSMVFGFVVLLGIMLVNKIGLNYIKEKIKFLLIILLFTGTISVLYVFVSRIVNNIGLYQLYTTLLLLICGLGGATYILGPLFGNSILMITEYLPVGILINSYKNISLNNSIKNNIIGYVLIIMLVYIGTYIIQNIKGDSINCES